MGKFKGFAVRQRFQIVWAVEAPKAPTKRALRSLALSLSVLLALQTACFASAPRPQGVSSLELQCTGGTFRITSAELNNRSPEQGVSTFNVELISDATGNPPSSVWSLKNLRPALVLLPLSLQPKDFLTVTRPQESREERKQQEKIELFPAGQLQVVDSDFPGFALTATGKVEWTQDGSQKTSFCPEAVELPKRLKKFFQLELGSVKSVQNALAQLAPRSSGPSDSSSEKAGKRAVGFDIDDTLLFTSPSFARGFATGGKPAPTDQAFWNVTNACDAGCAASDSLPAVPASPAKVAALRMVEWHLKRGEAVYAITARPETASAKALREYIFRVFGIPKENVLFEPEVDQPGNPAGKHDALERLGISVFYGDSDTDITDAQKVGVQAIRFERAPESSNRKGPRLSKYHPGYYGELVIEDSYW